MSDPNVMSIRVNDYKTTWIVYVDGRKERGPALANDEGGLIHIMRGLVEECGRANGIEGRIDFESPHFDGGLPHGDRVFMTVGSLISACSTDDGVSRSSRTARPRRSSSSGEGTGRPSSRQDLE